MNIAVDLDGVLADSEIMAIRLTNKLFKKKLKSSDYKEWDFLSKAIGKENAKKIYSLTWRYYKQIKPSEPNLLLKLKKLKRFGQIYLLTIRISTFEIPYIIKWLEKHGLNIFDGYIFLVNGSKDILNPFFSYYIDDSSINAKKIISDKKNNSCVFIYDRPWNQDIRDLKHGNLIRVYDLDDVIEHLTEMHYVES